MSADQSPYPPGMSDAEQAAYDKGFDDGFCDGANNVIADAVDLISAAKALTAAVDAMWNDALRRQAHRWEAHARAITAAQSILESGLIEFERAHS